MVLSKRKVGAGSRRVIGETVVLQFLLFFLLKHFKGNGAVVDALLFVSFHPVLIEGILPLLLTHAFTRKTLQHSYVLEDVGDMDLILNLEEAIGKEPITTALLVTAALDKSFRAHPLHIDA